jgi:hypothetical protein
MNAACGGSVDAPVQSYHGGYPRGDAPHLSISKSYSDQESPRLKLPAQGFSPEVFLASKARSSGDWFGDLALSSIGSSDTRLMNDEASNVLNARRHGLGNI